MDWTEKGISQILHLRTPLPVLTWIFMCLVSLLLWAQEYSHISHLYGFSPVWDLIWTVRLEVFLNTFPQYLQVSFLLTFCRASMPPFLAISLMRLGSMGGNAATGLLTKFSTDSNEVEVTSSESQLLILRSSASSMHRSIPLVSSCSSFTRSSFFSFFQTERSEVWGKLVLSMNGLKRSLVYLCLWERVSTQMLMWCICSTCFIKSSAVCIGRRQSAQVNLLGSEIRWNYLKQNLS